MRCCLACDQPFASTNGWTCPACGFLPTTRNGITFFASEVSESAKSFPEVFEDLFQFEASNFWFRSRNKLLLWAIGKYFPHARNFLEIGCGTGFVLSGIRESFPSINLCASELYEKGLLLARQRLSDIDFLQMDARQIPYREEFDLIGAFDVLEHIEEDELILRQMRKAVRTAGGIMLTVPQHKFLWSSMDDYSRHLRRYTAQDLQQKVERAGFKISHMTSFVSLLMPLMFFARLTRKQVNTEVDAFSEFRMSRMLNKMLEGLMDFERIFIKLGISFPAGGSLLVVARTV